MYLIESKHDLPNIIFSKKLPCYNEFKLNLKFIEVSISHRKCYDTLCYTYLRKHSEKSHD